jgi:hypothetical protein
MLLAFDIGFINVSHSLRGLRVVYPDQLQLTGRIGHAIPTSVGHCASAAAAEASGDATQNVPSSFESKKPI